MPDARVQAAIDNWAPRFTTNGVDLERLPRHHRPDRALGGVARRVVRDRGGTPGARRAGARRGPRAHRRRGVRAGRGLLSLRQVRLGPRRRAQPRDDGAREGGPVRRARAARPDRRAHRAAARRRARRRQPAPPRGRGAPAARGPRPRPGLHEGGVLPLGGRVPRARVGDAVARRPGPGRDGLPPADPPRLRGRGRRRARRARRARRPRPRPRRRGRREHGRLLRAARGRLRAAHQGRGGRQRPVQHGRALGCAAGA